MKEQGIYKILNLKNGKAYYGSSLNLEKRLYEHERNLRLGQHENKHLQNAWNKYSEDNFIFEVVEEVPFIEDYEENNRNLRNIETEYIQKYQTYKPEFGYNFIPGGIGTYGLPCSEEKKKKISEANKGRVAYNAGVPMSEEQRQLIKKIKTEKYGKAIDIYTINKVFIETIPSIREVSRKYKVSRNTIKNCCDGLTEPINLIFRYHEDSLDTVGINKPKKSKLKTAEAAKKYRESRGKAIDIYNYLGEFIKTYPAIVAIREDLGLSESTIRRGLKEKCLSGNYFFRESGEPLGDAVIKISPKSIAKLPTLYFVYNNEELVSTTKYKKDLEQFAYNREKSLLQRLLKNLLNIGDKISYHEFVIELNLAPISGDTNSKSLQSEQVSEVSEESDANGES